MLMASLVCLLLSVTALGCNSMQMTATPGAGGRDRWLVGLGDSNTTDRIGGCYICAIHPHLTSAAERESLVCQDQTQLGSLILCSPAAMYDCQDRLRPSRL